MTHYRGGGKSELLCYGPSGSALVFARWAPSGAALQTLLEAAGVVSVTRNGAGLWTIAFVQKPRELINVTLTPTYTDAATQYHRVFISQEYDPALGILQVSHRSVAVASVASGDAATDTLLGLRFSATARFNA